jgi:hypothetical protein
MSQGSIRETVEVECSVVFERSAFLKGSTFLKRAVRSEHIVGGESEGVVRPVIVISEVEVEVIGEKRESRVVAELESGRDRLRGNGERQRHEVSDGSLLCL